VHADAPFVGRLAQRDGGVLVYRVQVRVKGHLTRRMRVHGLRGCGVPRRTGLLLDRRHGVWWPPRR
jgi:hypothetical protein